MNLDMPTSESADNLHLARATPTHHTPPPGSILTSTSHADATKSRVPSRIKVSSTLPELGTKFMTTATWKSTRAWLSSAIATVSEPAVTMRSTVAKHAKPTSTAHVSSILWSPPNNAHESSILWHQPPKSNNAKQLSVPKLFLTLLSAQSVFATTLDHPPPFAPVSAPTPDPSPHSYECPQAQEPCGHDVCFDPLLDWCCPDNMNVCKRTEGCVKADTGNEVWMYGCGPLNHKPGNDSEIQTTSVYGGVPVTTTMVSNGTTLVTTTRAVKSTSASTSLAKPTGSGGIRICVPRIISILYFIYSAHAVALQSLLRPECCGDICCSVNEICTRSSTGAKCWPKAGKHAVLDSKESTAVGESSPQATRLLKEGQQGEEEVAVHIATAGVVRDVVEESGGRRKAVPKMLYVFVILIAFVAARLSPRLSVAANDTPVPGILQIDSSTNATVLSRAEEKMRTEGVF